MKRSLMIGFTVVALVAVAVVASAQGQRRGRGRACFMSGAPSAALKLSAEQTKQVEALRQTFNKDTEKLTTSLVAKVKALAELKSAEKPDVARVNATQAEVDRLRKALQRHHQTYREAVTKLLTADQRKNLAGGCGGVLCPRDGECELCGLCQQQCPQPGLGNGPNCPRGFVGCGMRAGAGPRVGRGPGTGPFCPLRNSPSQ